MGEVKRVIAVEREHYLIVIRCYEIRKCIRTVVPVSADNNHRIGGVCPYSLDAMRNNSIPTAAIVLFCNFIEQFKRDSVPIGGVTLRQSFPKKVKSFLKFLIFKKTVFTFAFVKRKARSLV